MKLNEFKIYEQELSKEYNLTNVIKYECTNNEIMFFALDEEKGLFFLNQEVQPISWLKSIDYLTISEQSDKSEANRDIALAGLFAGGFFTTGAGIVTMGSKGPSDTTVQNMDGRIIKGLVIRAQDKNEKDITIFTEKEFCILVNQELAKFIK
ncbi:hypothetical protein [Anaerorhabdus sp.]|uniref:hypothetical protein n=1 Tax=Anaerorhabdus sp. TaxID=1872524 RepID=UPI002FC61779